jgi:hypothetical protein
LRARASPRENFAPPFQFHAARDDIRFNWYVPNGQGILHLGKFASIISSPLSTQSIKTRHFPDDVSFT